MTSELSTFAARLRERIQNAEHGMRNAESPDCLTRAEKSDEEFDDLALELFGLQFRHNAPYRRFCEARGVTPDGAGHWREIPAIPTVAFKELELTCLLPSERPTVFHSSGTTEQRPSRHFHNAESLAIYDASLLPWFRAHVVPDLKARISNLKFGILTPSPVEAPHSSLVHMFETVRRALGQEESAYAGKLAPDGSWALDFPSALDSLRKGCDGEQPFVLLGTAFSLVQLLDFLAGQSLCFRLPSGSRVMETGGYKGRWRSVSKAELHALIAQRLGVPASHLVSEYGMSELSSQAYDRQVRSAECGMRNEQRAFHFPPWARAQIVSPETGEEVGEGETGLIRIFDLANVFSVMAIQTEDLGIRRADGFELIGRVALAEARGCSLMAV